MNKLLISLLCLLFMAPALHSEPITPEQAQMAAANFTHKRQESTARLSKPVSATLKSTIHDADKPLAFIAELEPTGFLILSGDTDLQPVIAYSFRHAWNADTSSDNPLYHLVKHDLMLRRQAVPLLDEIFIKRNHNAWQTLLNSRLSKSAAVFRQWPEPGSSSTGGWLESVWTQHSPYNDFCPLDPVTGNRCVTGCVATALAQVVHYHRFIGDLSFDAADAYTTGTRKIEIDSDSSSCDFPSFPRLNDYLNDLKSRYFDGGSLTNRDKAALNFACGIAVKMNYTSSSSGAPSSALETALKHHFSYESADYISDLRETNAVDDFYYRLQENMMNAFPALLDIAKLNISMAHVIACDGYNSDNFYHLNFGWGSTSPDAIPDAWYALPHAMPAGYGIITGAVVNIHPGLWYRELSSNTQWIQIPPCTIGAESDIRSVTLRNNSDWNMTVHSAVTSAPFSVSAYTHSFSDSVGPFSLGPDEELTLYTRCIPDSVGKLDRALTVHASGENQYLNVHMTGYGIPETGTAVNPGPVSGTWDKARSPYYVCGNIAIEPGDILHIQPGVDIIFMGRFALTVGEQAQLRACGSRSDSIRFDAYDAQQGWSGIVFDQSAGNDSLCFCRLTHAVYIQETNDYGGALSIYNSSPVILNSCLRKNRGFYGGALYGDQAGPFLQNCVIDENQADECGGAFYLKKQLVSHHFKYRDMQKPSQYKRRAPDQFAIGCLVL
ncbi:MAG: C10 family peptidase [candidate division KSB1 bacterium]|nr:C10 family peptidase [candidate division KSB1 bacterium]